MRLQPPKDWPHESMTEDMFDEYILAHTLIHDSESIKILDFYNSMLKDANDRFEVAMIIADMFPITHQLDFLRSWNRIT